jgi:hypothetical protein
VITKFIKTGKIAKKLNWDTLTSTIARFFIKCNIPFLIIEDEDFRELLRLCNPVTKLLVCGRSETPWLPSSDQLSSRVSKSSETSFLKSKQKSASHATPGPPLATILYSELLHTGLGTIIP